MVKTVIYNNEKDYQCEICKMVYGTKELANKCENWCRENQSCNLEIIKHAKKKNEK